MKCAGCAAAGGWATAVLRAMFAVPGQHAHTAHRCRFLHRVNAPEDVSGGWKYAMWYHAVCTINLKF